MSLSFALPEVDLDLEEHASALEDAGLAEHMGAARLRLEECRRQEARLMPMAEAVAGDVGVRRSLSDASVSLRRAAQTAAQAAAELGAMARRGVAGAAGAVATLDALRAEVEASDCELTRARRAYEATHAALLAHGELWHGAVVAAAAAEAAQT